MPTNDPNEPGLVLATDGLTVLDLRTMPWRTPSEGQPFFGTGMQTKLLARADDGWPAAQMLYRPSGSRSSAAHGQAERHYHRYAREWVYVIEGELSFREYTDTLDPEGDPVVYRAGYLLDRLPGPGSAHGVDPSGTSSSHASLELRAGPATANGEPEYEKYNVAVTSAAIAAGTAVELPEDPVVFPDFDVTAAAHPGLELVRSTPRMRLIDTLRSGWAEVAEHPLPGVTHAQCLSSTPSGEVQLENVHLDRTARPASRTAPYRQLLLVTQGRGALTFGDSVTELRRGVFADIAAGVEHRIAPHPDDPMGLTAMIWHAGLLPGLAQGQPREGLPGRR